MSLIQFPVIPEPPRTDDPTLDEYLRRVKDSINQIFIEVNSLRSEVDAL